MCNKSVITSPSAIKSVSKCYKTQEMCDKAVDTCHFLFDFVPDRYKTKKWMIKLFLKYSFNKYKTKEICEKAIICWH